MILQNSTCVQTAQTQDQQKVFHVSLFTNE